MLTHILQAANERLIDANMMFQMLRPYTILAYSLRVSLLMCYMCGPLYAYVNQEHRGEYDADSSRQHSQTDAAVLFMTDMTPPSYKPPSEFRNDAYDKQQLLQRDSVARSVNFGSSETSNRPMYVSEDDAMRIQHYLRDNKPETSEDTVSSMNLAAINDRAAGVKQNQVHISTRSSGAKEQQYIKPNSNRQAKSKPITFSSVTQSNNFERRNLMPPKHVPGRQFDATRVVSNPMKIVKHSAKSLIPPHSFPLNCIEAAVQSYGPSRCEDHFIRRLDQDVTEGRTAVDVTRRLCCALFWHKDCINRVVVERCPDSSPTAAETLLGSRKLDLVISCQHFNRDGCNGTLRLRSNALIASISILLSLVLFIV